MAKALARAALLAALALAASSGTGSAQYQPPAPPDGPMFTPEQMQAGTQLTAQDCVAYRRTVFVQAQGVGICFRYYISDAGGNADEAVYWLEGDRAPERLAYDPATFERSALQMSRRYRRPAIYLARQGLDGSSGWHRGWRRTFFEV